MPIRSHVDLCLFIRFIQIKKEKIPEGTLKMILQAPDRDRYFTAWREQYNSTPATIFHEAYHYWQGLRLPFLQMYACFAVRGIFQTFRELCKFSPDIHQWDCFTPQLHFLDQKRSCWRIEDTCFAVGIEDGEKPPEFEEEIRLSPIDLLEGAASLAEWQFVCPSDEAAIDPLLFTRWRKRNPAYVDAFYFVVRALKSEELALRCFNPLVCAAFETTDPVRTFVHLLAILVGQLDDPFFQKFIAQPEPCRWTYLFDDFLNQLEFEPNPDKILGPTTPLIYHRIDLAEFVEGNWSGTEYAHPFLTKLSREWLKREKANPQYSWLLPQLRWVHSDTFLECHEDFQPPLTIACFETEKDGNRIILVGDIEAGFQFPDHTLADLLTIYSTVRRATNAHFDSDHRLCHHTNCPEYLPNYCNSYPMVPNSFQTCGFRKRVDNLYQIFKDL